MRKLILLTLLFWPSWAIATVTVRVGGNTRIHCASAPTVDYGLTAGYGSTATTTYITTSYWVDLVLTPTVPYHFRVTTCEGVTADNTTGTGTADPSQVGIDSGVNDIFGGRITKVPYFHATGGWHTEKKGSRWYFVTPTGSAFFKIGVFFMDTGRYQNTLDANSTAVIVAKYGDADLTWGPAQVRRIKGWGFNTVLGTSSLKYTLPWTTHTSWPGDHTQPSKIPATYAVFGESYPGRDVFSYCSNASLDAAKLSARAVNLAYYNFTMALISDPWDTCFATWTNTFMQDTDPAKGITQAIASPYTIGLEMAESDYLFGFEATGTGDFATVPAGHNNAHLGALQLIASPLQSYGLDASSNPHVYKVSRTVQAKQQLNTYLSGLYSIGTLNTRWGSSYSAFGTCGTNQTRSLGTGDGVTKTFTVGAGGTVPVDRDTVYIKNASAVVAGDDMAGNLKDTGAFTGTVNYATGAWSVTFVTAPANGNAIVADYYSGGWEHGSCLLDEDGRNTWMPSGSAAYQNLAGTTANFKADMDGFLAQFADKFFKVQADAVHTYAPGKMFLGPNVLGSWGTPPRAPILQKAGLYLDAANIMVGIGAADDQARFDFVYANFGDKPWAGVWVGIPQYNAVTSDNSIPGNPPLADVVYPNITTQAVRGTTYQTQLTNLVNATTNTVKPMIGLNWWALTDDNNEQVNWGLVTRFDNAYDGVEARINGCSYGVPCGTGGFEGRTYGGEIANYGNFLTPVKNANLGVYLSILP